MTNPEIAAEQAYLDRAHARLDTMREAARALSSEVLALGAGGTFANRVERDVRVELSERRLAQLRVGDGSVVFGRLDMLNGERFYIGRIGISDEHGDPLVVDWRAPVAEPFYRATAALPLGVARRRHFIFRGRRITAIDDELLDREASEDKALVLMGEGALLAGLKRARTGRMADIVATIQAEQDAVIRSDLAGPLVVQGGAGTGKTAVALHRAAYLLFTHRLRLERDGVLLIGPNAVFLRYIEQVLPSLGEHTVALATPAVLYAGSTRPTLVERPPIAVLKGDARMSRVLARAVETRQRALREPLQFAFRGERVSFGVNESRQLVDALRVRRGTHNARRAVLEQRLGRSLARAWLRSAEASARAGRRAKPSDAEVHEAAEELSTELRRMWPVREALERMWPVLTPEQLLHDLFGARPLLRRAADGVLEPDETDLLVRERSPHVSSVPWTDADVALLDEAAMLLGPRRAAGSGRRRQAMTVEDAWMLERGVDDQTPDCPNCGARLSHAGGSRPWHCDRCGRTWTSAQVMEEGEEATLSQLRNRFGEMFSPASVAPPPRGARLYGHAVVDEAQGLAAMQWRSVGRRVPSGSFTIVGDLGQASMAGSPESWGEVIGALPGREKGRVVELSVNYRTPEEVMAVAAPVLKAAAPGLSPPKSARAVGVRPEVTRAAQGDLEAAVAEAAAQELGAMTDGKVAVIAPAALVRSLAGRLDAPHADSEQLSTKEADRVLDARVSVFSVSAARGLEFDSVVIVEPAAIVDEEAFGLRALYVAMTRTTQRLHIVHAAELPPVLAEVLESVLV